MHPRLQLSRTVSPALLGLAISLIAAAPADAINITSITTGFNQPVGIDHHQPTNKVVLSVNYPSGLPYNFELVDATGARQQFSTFSGLSDEVKIATARDNLGGFAPGELFCGSGAAGVVVRISADGSTIQNPWVTLPGEGGLLRGSLHVDRTGVYGGDLIVVTTNGGVWRVSSAGVPTFIQNVGTHLEGMTTIPNNVSQYGPWAGKILVGAENQGLIYAFDAAGNFTTHALGISVEDIDVIPANENWFAVDYAGARLVGAPASEFSGIVGDVLIAQEGGGLLFSVRWDGNQFVVTPQGSVFQFEHMTFSTAGINEVPTPVEPTSWSRIKNLIAD